MRNRGRVGANLLRKYKVLDSIVEENLGSRPPRLELIVEGVLSKTRLGSAAGSAGWLAGWLAGRLTGLEQH